MSAMPNGDEYLDISESIVMRDDAPFYGSVFDLEDYMKVVQESISALENSMNARQVVLETWLLVDYAVRELLSNLWGLKQFNSEDEDFDLRYQLLPSFERCIWLLEKVLSIQRALNIQRALEKDPEAHRLTMPVRFIHFYRNSYPDDFERFRRIEQDYYRKYYPQLAAPEAGVFTTGITLSPFKRKYSVNTVWVEALRDLDVAWFKLARRLGKARNVAAHSYNASRILLAFGYTGPSAADRTKDECKEMLGKLLGIALKQQARIERVEPGS